MSPTVARCLNCVILPLRLTPPYTWRVVFGARYNFVCFLLINLHEEILLNTCYLSSLHCLGRAFICIEWADRWDFKFDVILQESFVYQLLLKAM